MKIEEAFNEIIENAHFWNWVPDWQVARDIYLAFPNSYSILSPFAYSYLEELIRTTTSEYGAVIYDENHIPIKKRKVGLALVKFAIKENQAKNPELSNILEELKQYYQVSKRTDEGDNRHSVAHGYTHPRFWHKESFEKLILDIARLSKHSGF